MGEANPPLIEQLVTPNALRQRRFRERQQALRDGDVTPDPALCNDPDVTPDPEIDDLLDDKIPLH